MSTVQRWVAEAPPSEVTVKVWGPSAKSGIETGLLHSHESPSSSRQVAGPGVVNSKFAVVWLVRVGGAAVNSTMPPGPGFDS